MDLEEIFKDIEKRSPDAYNALSKLYKSAPFKTAKLLIGAYNQKPDEIIFILESFEKANLKKSENQWADNLACSLEDLIDCMYGYKSGTANSIFQKLAVVTAVKGGVSSFVFMVIKTFGVASTGTAISSLSGAAAVTATYYWIGGSVFSGVIILSFIGISVGWIVKNKTFSKKRDLDKFNEIETKIETSASQLIYALRRYTANDNKATQFVKEIVRRDAIAPIVENFSELSDNHLGFFKKRKLKSACENISKFACQLKL